MHARRTPARRRRVHRARRSGPAGRLACTHGGRDHRAGRGACGGRLVPRPGDARPGGAGDRGRVGHRQDDAVAGGDRGRAAACVPGAHLATGRPRGRALLLRPRRPARMGRPCHHRPPARPAAPRARRCAVVDGGRGAVARQAVGSLIARRPGAERRPHSFERSLDEARAERLRLGPLPPGSLHRLIVERHGQGLPRPLLARVARASLGNPLHALEIAGALLRQGLPAAGDVLPVPEDVQSLVAARVRRLAPATREALLLAAALSRPVPGVVPPDRLAEAEEQRLVAVGEDGTVTFTHPAFAAAVYAAAPRQRQRAAHRELAARVTEVEERARHLALAADGPDEAVAGLLDRAAAAARSRGAPEAAAELTERARALTPPGDQAGAHRRTLAAAEHHFHAGDWGRARGLLEVAAAGAPDELARGEALRLLGQVRYHQDNWPEAIALFQEALALGSPDARLTVTIRLQLAFASVATGELEAAAAHIGQALAWAERLGERSLLAEALAGSAWIGFLRGQGVDATRLARSLELEDPDWQTMIYLRPTLIAGLLALYLGDLEGARAKLGGLCSLVTERGEESDLPFVLTNLAWLECLG